MALLTRLVVEVSWVADMDVAVSAMNGGIWLKSASMLSV
jgi:hypothetical protein